MGDDQLFTEQLDGLFAALQRDDHARALDLIGQIGDKNNTMALEPLLALLEYPDEQIRGAAAAVLGRLGLAQAVEPLIKALDDPSATVQEKAAIALGDLGDVRAAGPLENVPPEPSRVKAAARFALMQIASKSRKGPLPKKPDIPGGAKAGTPPRPVAADGAYAPKPAAPPATTAPSAPPAAGTPATAKRAVASETAGEDTDLPPKSPLLAAIASLIVPGVGQLYNGDSALKALLHWICCMIGNLLIVPGLLVRIYSSYEAYSTAKKINDGLLPNKKTNMLIIVFIAAIAIVIVIAMTVILAAVIAAFVFQMGGSVPDTYKSVSIGIYGYDPGVATVKNYGGADAATLTGIHVYADGTEVTATSGRVTSEVSSSATYPIQSGQSVTIYGDFTDGTVQMLWVGSLA